MSIDREPGRLIDRRAVFLFASALVSLLLVPLSPSDLRYVGVVLTGLVLSRGANYVHGLWDRLNNAGEVDE